MKFLFVLSLFVVFVLTLNLVLAQSDGGEDENESGGSKVKLEPKKSIQFGKVLEGAGQARVYDPCNSNPYDHSGCASACWYIGYYYGGFCSGYSCYCYI